MNPAGYRRMARVIRWLGSLPMAVSLLTAIGATLALGTLYEVRFGTPAVQRAIYGSWWFQGLLGFLGINLAVAAWRRRPWKLRHLPFVLAHAGLILLLIGGMLSGRFALEGQLVLPEGQATRTLDLDRKLLVVEDKLTGWRQATPASFDTRTWIRQPHQIIARSLPDRPDLEVMVDRYEPDATVEEVVRADGGEDNPAIRVRLAYGEHHDTTWLLARVPNRFAVSWGLAKILLMEPTSTEQMAALSQTPPGAGHPRGVVFVRLPGSSRDEEVPVPEPLLHEPMPIGETPYRLTFTGYFADFLMTDQGPTSRSTDPHNPAVAVTLEGPEGREERILLAFHPDLSTRHGWASRVPATLTYAHPAASAPPLNSIAVLRLPSGKLMAVLVEAAGDHHLVDPLSVGETITHPSLGYQMTLEAATERAVLSQRVISRSDQVKQEAVHLVAREGAQTAQAWLGLPGSVSLTLHEHPLTISYEPARQMLPFTFKLLDFRHHTYPGTQIASDFESDVELSDSARGIIVLRTIRMNHPLAYRGFAIFQSSYTKRGMSETGIFSVRKDPGTPLVFAGFLTVLSGIVGLFVSGRSSKGVTKEAVRTPPVSGILDVNAMHDLRGAELD